jgi:hypothetical protein
VTRKVLLSICRLARRGKSVWKLDSVLVATETKWFYSRVIGSAAVSWRNCLCPACELQPWIALMSDAFYTERSRSVVVANPETRLLAKNRVSDNVGGIKLLSTILRHALREERHFALVEEVLFQPRLAS